MHQGAHGGKEAAGSSNSARKTVLAAGQIAAVLAASAAEVNPEAAAQTAATTITYNYLTPRQLAKIIKSAEACGNDVRCRQLVADSAHMFSESQDYSLRAILRRLTSDQMVIMSCEII
ncbi:hypothetical protein [Varunaivibrio sulfuroxidans]|uniref:Uncharacterized protein n=1 Tax=Varunaivibrio sulfuroxidans TaxID=1773489 RepID=A0A4R3JCQ5_9PROT|nr:hypothetical protein [Varunaivibrio sulfuroxidans]TCS62913.1 hypothetical protein EDD55_1042 [Varunaivibrio sulfuroxidans]WES32008.1 hypothetical protein P3M64_06540 [Varunaivibrio sulfuroxidans]